MCITDSSKQVSVVMVSYYTGIILWRSIESVLRQDSLKQLILVNNGNEDAVLKRLEILAESNPKLVIVTGHGNIGFAKGCNLGVRHATGEYIALVNPDSLLPDQVFIRGMKALSLKEDYWVAGARITNLDGSEQRGSRRRMLSPLIAVIEGLQLHRLFSGLNHYQTNLMPADEAELLSEIDVISGAYMLMKKTVYQQVEGMDERYFLHVEDADFCKKIQLEGGKVIHQADVRVIHYRSTSDAPNLVVEWHKTISLIRYFNKYAASFYQLVMLLPLHAAMLLRYVLKGAIQEIKKINPFALLKQWLRPKPQNRAAKIRRIILSGKENQQSVLSEDTEAKEIMITGATGQVGAVILTKLLEGSNKITAFFHQTVIDAEHPNLQWRYTNLSEDTAFDCISQPDNSRKILIHTAAIWYLPMHIRKLKAAGVEKIIAFSSNSIAGKAHSGNSYEQILVKRLQESESKVKKECEKYGIQWTILRPTMIYGVGLDYNITSIQQFIQRFNFFPLYGNGLGLRQPVHVEDLAQAVLQIIQQPQAHQQTYLLSGGEVLSYKEMVQRIFAQCNKKPRFISLPLLPLLLDYYGKIRRKASINGFIARRMNQDLHGDHSLATKDLAYKPRNFLVQ